MKFQTSQDEILFAAEVIPERDYMFDRDLRTGLSIIWNTGATARFMIDNETFMVPQNCIMFLTEYHIIEDLRYEQLNIIQFNRPFYCVQDDDSEVGCKGVLFFGASRIPKIEIPEDRTRQFQVLWEVLMMELDESDKLKLEMLRALLKRFLILCLRVYSNQNLDLPSDNVSVGLIREYNYLVEKHYKMYTKVADYAKLLHKSPKTLANIFKKYIDKTPLQIINDRRYLEARRQLKYTEKTIQEIADEINFKDVQSFSHFFRSREGISPSQYRNQA